jgi:hypothetical protein
MDISYTDSDTTDRTLLLQSLGAGDTITGAGITWTIQSAADQTTYMRFTVTPAATGSPTGVQNFDFATNAPQPVDYQQDTGYWTGQPAVEGLFIADGDYDDIIPDENQYIIDLQLQDFTASEDWDYQAVSGGSGGATQQLTSLEADWVRVSAEPYDIFNVQTTDNMWTTAFVIDDIPVGEAITGIGLVKAVRTDADDYYLTEFRAIAANTGGGIAVNETQLYELGPIQLAIRVQQVGLNAEVQVRGSNNEDWSWTGLVYFSPM